MTEDGMAGARWGSLPDRESVWVGGLVTITLAFVAGLLVWALQEDRDALVAIVEQERLEQLDNVVLLVSADVDDVLDDLKFMVRIASTGPADTQHDAIEALLAGISAYRAVAVWEAVGAPSLEVVDPRNPPPPAELTAVMLDTSRKLQSAPARLTVSPVIAAEGATYRVFGYGTKGGPRAVLAVETSAWLSGMRLVSSDPSNRVLVLGPESRVSPASDPVVAAHLAAEVVNPEIASVLTLMQQGARGTTRLSDAAGAAIGHEEARPRNRTGARSGLADRA